MTLSHSLNGDIIKTNLVPPRSTPSVYLQPLSTLQTHLPHLLQIGMSFISMMLAAMMVGENQLGALPPTAIFYLPPLPFPLDLFVVRNLSM